MKTVAILFLAIIGLAIFLGCTQEEPVYSTDLDNLVNDANSGWIEDGGVNTGEMVDAGTTTDLENINSEVNSDWISETSEVNAGEMI